MIKFFITILSVFGIKDFYSEVHSVNESPKASYEEYIGNHIENLAAHKFVDINPSNFIKELNDLPEWISKLPDSNDPKIYSGLFWQIEPIGEYVYYLAGDFKKNEKGLLKYGSASTSIFVEVNFEDDVINVAKIDGLNEQKIADQQKDILEFVRNLTIKELSDRVPASTDDFDDRVVFLPLGRLLSKKSKGQARLIFSKNEKVAYITLIYSEFREPSKENEYLRYTTIKVRSLDPNMRIEVLVNQYLNLVNKYSNMPYVYLSGTTRA